MVESGFASCPDSIPGTEQLTVGAGCFWCIDSVYRHIEGVQKTIVGYAGGNTENPNYDDICYKQTNHAEVVRVFFEPNKITYARLLEIFFKVHDPTTLNKQGHDEGPQYRSTIMYHNDEQKATAWQVIEQQKGIFADSIVTEVVPAPKFWPAEEFHQDYWNKNPNDGYCAFTVVPKIQKIKDIEEFNINSN